MPALKGSLTYARFFVDGELPADFRDKFVKAIRLRAMKPLEPDEDALERSGWCRVGEPFEIDLGYEDVFYNEFVNLAFRTDRWVVPGRSSARGCAKPRPRTWPRRGASGCRRRRRRS